MAITQIIAGGQTGVDRAALDVALEAGIPCGGWCPKGRKSEEGPIPDKYALRETPSDVYAQRTRWNVRDSDGTLILARGPLVGGTALTRTCAEDLGKPCLIVDPADASRAATVCEWLGRHEIQTLNVAGPRESTQPGIYQQAAAFLRVLLKVACDADDR